MGGRRTQYHRLSALCLLLLAAPLPAADAGAEAGTTADDDGAGPVSPPSLELFMFLAEWSETGEWIDPLALDQAMNRHPTATADETEHDTQAND